MRHEPVAARASGGIDSARLSAACRRATDERAVGRRRAGGCRRRARSDRRGARRRVRLRPRDRAWPDLGGGRLRLVDAVGRARRRRRGGRPSGRRASHAARPRRQRRPGLHRARNRRRLGDGGSPVCPRQRRGRAQHRDDRAAARRGGGASRRPAGCARAARRRAAYGRNARPRVAGPVLRLRQLSSRAPGDRGRGRARGGAHPLARHVPDHARRGRADAGGSLLAVPGRSGAVGARGRRFASCACRLEGRARCDRRSATPVCPSRTRRSARRSS